MRDLDREHPELSGSERRQAAELIQRNYRGYRERRQMRGLGLDASSRWVEAFKEARYRSVTMPRPRDSLEESGSRLAIEGSRDVENGSLLMKRPSEARRNWNKLGTIVKRAANDEDPSIQSSDDEESEESRRMKAEQRAERQKSARTMVLQYWLEMVDVRHRYGTNLKIYHEEWQKSNTRDNFFYWLDYGEGRQIDCVGCPRERLDRERVRYLSKEERFDYLVKIDKDGLLRWAKNGNRIDTTVKYKDSVRGIVPIDSDVPEFKFEDEDEAAQDCESDSYTSGEGEEGMRDARQHHENDSLDNAKGRKKVKYVSPATILNKLLRSSVKDNTWIFVADTNFRLYVGIKQSGAFQHSSFLHGSRISAAGLLTINDGLLNKVSPLSGHYRPPVSSFRAFMQSLNDAGVDMSHVSISRSYALLIGLEAYIKTRKQSKKIVQKLIHGRRKSQISDVVRFRQEELDKSESIGREQRVPGMDEDDEKELNRVDSKFMRILRIGTRAPAHVETMEDGYEEKSRKEGGNVDGQTKEA